MRPFSVIIPSKDVANLKSSLPALIKKEPDLPLDQIIVVDDGIEGIEELPKVRFIKGEKPFIYARNINIGIRAAGDRDVFLWNDDAILETEGGLSALVKDYETVDNMGVCSTAVHGLARNPDQQQGGGGYRQTSDAVAFVSVFVPRRTIEQIGLLDERFTGYGCEDTDYCWRVSHMGLGLFVFDGCVVDHTGDHATSNFRTQKGHAARHDHNLELLSEKWRTRASRTKEPNLVPTLSNSEAKDRVVDILYCAKNRLEFTKQTFQLLLENTDWFSVKKLYVYDDGSEDGTFEWLIEAAGNSPVTVEFHQSDFGTPVELMGDFIERATAKYVAKIDNDIALPPEWLETCLDALRGQPHFKLLGLEAVLPHDLDPTATRVIEDCGHIGGIGVFDRSAFSGGNLPTKRNDKFGGFQYWQQENPDVLRGWLKPGLPVVVLDKVPVKPWSKLNELYLEKQWQRGGKTMYPDTSDIWSWL